MNELIHVPFIRISGHRLAGTLSRYLLTGLARLAVERGRSGVLVSEDDLSENLRVACGDLGFAPAKDGLLKLTLAGSSTAEALADRVEGLTFVEPELSRLASALRTKLDASTASAIEHRLWPARIADAELPTFLVPIRPEFAQHLFDEKLAMQDLFGADVELALNPESVYYRTAFQRIIEPPGRILWYVSQDERFQGTMAIRACSRIVEVSIGKPKQLFRRFRRLGVYEWCHLMETADGDVSKDIMAIRFDDTEQLRPIGWSEFQIVLKQHGIKTNLESPVRLPPEVFREVYSLAFDSPSVRHDDSVGS